MPTRWTPTASGVQARPSGPSTAASLAAAALTIAGTTLALLIMVALLLPTGSGSDGGGIANAGSPSPPVTAGGVVATPTSPAASGGVVTPAPSAAPATLRPTPAAGTPAPSGAPVQAQLRRPARLTAAGREVGRVTVQAIRQVSSVGAPIEDDERLMVATVRLDASLARLTYDELQWRLEDENGERWNPIEDAVREPLGAGTLELQSARTGQVAFAVPSGVKVRAVVLTDGSGADLVVFTRLAASA